MGRPQQQTRCGKSAAVGQRPAGRIYRSIAAAARQANAGSATLSARAALTGKHDTLVRRAPGWQGAADSQQAKN